MKRGDRVLGWWPAEKEWWYAGVICDILADGGFEVQYDDSQRAQLREDQIRLLDVGIGKRVHARWRGGPNYYPGRISMVEGGALHVQYDDGDQEWCTVSAFRIHRDDL